MNNNPEHPLESYLSPENIEDPVQPAQIPKNVSRILSGIGLGSDAEPEGIGLPGIKNDRTAESEPSASFIEHLQQQHSILQKVFESLAASRPNFEVPGFDAIRSTPNLDHLSDVYNRYSNANMRPKFLIVPYGLSAQEWDEVYSHIGVELEYTQLNVWQLENSIFDTKGYDSVKWVTCIMPSPDDSKNAKTRPQGISNLPPSLADQIDVAGESIYRIAEDSIYPNVNTLLTGNAISAFGQWSETGNHSVWLKEKVKINDNFRYLVGQCSENKVGIVLSDGITDLSPHQLLLPVYGDILEK